MVVRSLRWSWRIEPRCGVARRLAEEAVRLPFGAAYLARLANGEMGLDEFRSSQCRFRFAVDRFAPSMATLIGRLTSWRERMPLVANVAEEHGHGDPNRAHPLTFRAFLRSINATCPAPGADNGQDAGVDAFNAALAGLAAVGDTDQAIGAFAAIELAFSNISSLIGAAVSANGWADPVLHYSKHAWLDQDHADSLLALLDHNIGDPKRARQAIRGLRLGALLFRQFYDSLSPDPSP
jgi:pyrroloquinoline-quinone synthase